MSVKRPRVPPFEELEKLDDAELARQRAIITDSMSTIEGQVLNYQDRVKLDPSIVNPESGDWERRCKSALRSHRGALANINRIEKARRAAGLTAAITTGVVHVPTPANRPLRAAYFKLYVEVGALIAADMGAPDEAWDDAFEGVRLAHAEVQRLRQP
jgi:hypothetical protein